MGELNALVIVKGCPPVAYRTLCRRGRHAPCPEFKCSTMQPFPHLCTGRLVRDSRAPSILEHRHDNIFKLCLHPTKIALLGGHLCCLFFASMADDMVARFLWGLGFCEIRVRMQNRIMAHGV